MTEPILIYTDGACSGNPGPGGYGIILKYKENYKELSGGEKNTTNNRMELTGVIKALEALKRKCTVIIYSDSQYVCNTINKNWLLSWKNNNWKNKSGQTVKNKDLWEALDKLLYMHDVQFKWIKGHDGHPENERCDELAREQIKLQ